MDNVTVGFITMDLIIGSILLLGAIMKNGKAKHNQNKKNGTLMH